MTGESDRRRLGGSRAASDPELGCRIEAASAIIGRRPEAAAAGGISHDQLTRIIQGKARPSFETVVGIARKSGVSLEWLATGKGEMLATTRPKDEKLLSEVLVATAIVAVEQYLEEKQLTCPPEKKAELILLLCEIAKSESDLSIHRASIGRMLRLVS